MDRCIKKENISINRLSNEQEVNSALVLCWRVFCICNTLDNTKRGAETFKKTLKDDSFIGNLTMYGAYHNSRIIGMAAITRYQHISLFFIDPLFQGLGIGSRLFEQIKTDVAFKRFTVNSSPQSIDFYSCLGFEVVGEPKEKKGIHYVPMEMNCVTI